MPTWKVKTSPCCVHCFFLLPSNGNENTIFWFYLRAEYLESKSGSEGKKKKLLSWMKITAWAAPPLFLLPSSLCLLSSGSPAFLTTSQASQSNEKCINHATLDTVEPWSALMAPVHLAVGKFIFHKTAGAQWDGEKLSLVWHHQPQELESIKRNSSWKYVHLQTMRSVKKEGTSIKHFSPNYNFKLKWDVLLLIKHQQKGLFTEQYYGLGLWWRLQYTGPKADTEKEGGGMEDTAHCHCERSRSYH